MRRGAGRTELGRQPESHARPETMPPYKQLMGKAVALRQPAHRGVGILDQSQL